MGTFTFIATGDWHVDDATNSTRDPATGHPTAWVSHLACVDEIVSQAVGRQVDALVVAGDLFRNGRPTMEAVLLLRECLRPLVGSGVRLLLLGGNHETLNLPHGYRTAVETLGDLLAGDGVDVTVVEREAALVDCGGVCFLALPWLSKASVVAAHQAASLTPAQTDQLVIDHAVSQMDALAGGAPEGVPLVLVSHLTVDGLQIGGVAAGHHRGSELDLASVFSEPVMPRSTLEGYGFAHVALAHIHPRQRVGGNVFYVGSPDRLTFTDAGDDKGANLVSIDTGSGRMVGFEMLPTPARTMRVVDATDETQVQAVAGLPEGALLKVRLAPGERDLDDHLAGLVDAAGARVVSLVRSPAKVQHRQRATISEGATLTQALSAWVADTGAAVSEEDMKDLVGKAQALAEAASTEGEVK